MSKFLTTNASICQNSNHQREIKISSRAPMGNICFLTPASSQCPCLFLTVSWADPPTSRALQMVSFQPELEICDQTPLGRQKCSLLGLSGGKVGAF